MNDVAVVPVNFNDSSLDSVASQLLDLERDLVALEGEMSDRLASIAVAHRDSSRNLVHYVALRRRDLRKLQEQLAQHGLSSLGRAESSVMAGLLQASIRAHESLALRNGVGPELERLAQARQSAMSWDTAQALLHEHTVQMFGPRPNDRHIYIMVTAPPAAEADSAWMEKLLEAGMNVLRINCAHESESEWERIFDALSRAMERTGKSCRVLVDLAGPKIRTGAIEDSRRVAVWKPQRDALGDVCEPAKIEIRRASATSRVPGAPLSIADQAFERLRAGDELRFRDHRDKRRTLVIEELGRDSLLASSVQHTYLVERAVAQVRRGKKHRDAVVLEVNAPLDAAIDVRAGELLILTGRQVPGIVPERTPAGQVERLGVVPCTLPEALEHLQVDQRVLFDDGRIQTVVTAKVEFGDFQLRVVRTHKPTSKLRSEKGINLPDTRMTIPGLTQDDRRALAFVAKRADAVSISFVRSVEDVRALHAALALLERSDIGVVLKIETRAGFDNLPVLLLEGLRRPSLAVMIARGDLAVEVGFERLAELQEEILWLCEAAHVPAIWATQVLDTLARTGVPSRAEVTDASASVAAECVMLNKGPFVNEAVAVLAGILRRMEGHRYKKRSLYRKLEVSRFA